VSGGAGTGGKEKGQGVVAVQGGRGREQATYFLALMEKVGWQHCVTQGGKRLLETKGSGEKGKVSSKKGSLGNWCGNRLFRFKEGRCAQRQLGGLARRGGTEGGKQEGGEKKGKWKSWTKKEKAWDCFQCPGP